MEKCCVCGKSLPNRYAVAGRCKKSGCNKPFCTLHWNRSNCYCPEHGYQPAERSRKVVSAEKAPEEESDKHKKSENRKTVKDTENSPMSNHKEKNSSGKQKMTGWKAKKLMHNTITMVARLGNRTGDLVKSLKKDRSPQAMIATLDEKLESNRERRRQVSKRLEELFNTIAEKKKGYTSAPKAKQRVIQAELKSQLADYKTTEREHGILLENERHLSQIRGKLNEKIAYGMAGVTEDTFDEIASDIEEAADEAEGRVDAARDLGRAGKRRERPSDEEDLWGELEDFEMDMGSENTEETVAGEDFPEEQQTGQKRHEGEESSEEDQKERSPSENDMPPEQENEE